MTQSSSGISAENIYRPDIDGLRAFAVVAVILNHISTNLIPGGYLGVDVFFVISGFVITSSMARSKPGSPSAFLTRFYERRLKRLVPALCLYVFVAAIAICSVNPNAGHQLFTGIYALFGASNIYLFHKSTDYFAPLSELNIFMQTWSLGVEEQFYLLFPGIVWLSGFAVQSRKGDRNLLRIASCLGAASLSLFIVTYPADQSAAYFLMPFRFWEVAAGCIAFLVYRSKSVAYRCLSRIPAGASLAAIVLAMYSPVVMAPLNTIVVVLFSVALIVGINKHSQVFGVLTNPVFIYIGLISYSLYLWHWGVLVFARWTFGVHWWSAPFLVALMFGLSIASYEFIEKPLRFSAWTGKASTNIVYAFVSLVGMALLLVSLGRPLKGVLFSSRFKADEFSYVQDGMECELASDAATSDPLSCVPDPFVGPSILLLGNSHGSNLLNSLRESAQINGYDNVYYLTSAIKSRLGHDWHEHPELTRRFSKLKPDSLIVWSHSQVNVGNPDLYELVKAKLDYLVFLSRSTGVPVLLVDDVPSFGGDQNFYPKFAFRGSGPRVSLQLALAERSQHTSILKSAARSAESVFYFDPLDKLCDSSVCPSVIGDLLVYADSSPHFTKKGSLLLVDPLARKIAGIRERSLTGGR